MSHLMSSLLAGLQMLFSVFFKASILFSKCQNMKKKKKKQIYIEIYTYVIVFTCYFFPDLIFKPVLEIFLFPSAGLSRSFNQISKSLFKKTCTKKAIRFF